MTDTEKYGYAIAENFIDTIWTEGNVNFWNRGRYFEYDCFTYSLFTKEVLNMTVTNIVQFLKGCIEKNYYITFSTDVYYIKNYVEAYRRGHATHQMFLSGYCDKGFYSYDFFDFRFETGQIVSFEDIEEAYNNNGIENNAPLYQTDLQLVKLNGNSRMICADRIINGLERFLNSEQLFNDQEFIFGLKCFSKIRQEVCDNTFKVKSSLFIYVHIQMMIMRLQILQSKMPVAVDWRENLEKLDKLSQKSILLKNICVKLSLKTNNKNTLKASEMIKEIKIQYESIIQDIIRILRKSF